MTSTALSTSSKKLICLSEYIAPNEFLQVLSECLERGQEFIFTPTGSSMLPMLDGRNDTVTFSPKPERLKKYDVAFYIRRRTDQLVLHRMIGFTDDGGYVFSGDNQYYYEYGVTDDDVLALMTSFTHKGRHHKVTDFSYRFYIRRMMFKKRLRIFLSKIYRKLRG